MAYTGTGIVSYGFPMDDFNFTYLLSGQAASDAGAQAAVGLAVTFDITAANTMKVCGDGDPIHGRVKTAEFRGLLGFSTVAVERKFKELLPIDATNSTGIAVGDYVIGAANGVVKKNVGGTSGARVLEVLPGFVSVELL